MRSNQRLNLKVLPSHKIALRRLAEADGETMAVVVRRLIRQAAHERGFWPLANQYGQGEQAKEKRHGG